MAFCNSNYAFYAQNWGGSIYDGTVTGVRFLNQYYCRVFNGDPDNTVFPGDTEGTHDWTSSYNGTYGVRRIHGLPTTAQLVTRMSGVFKDLDGGGVYLAYNDEGTIKKVALS